MPMSRGPAKSELRQKYRQIRNSKSAAEKDRADGQILKSITGLPVYRDENIILAYVSIGSEADTYGLIKKALSDGKKVAVPKCKEGTPFMDFYLINSLDELKEGSFNVPEPLGEESRRLADLSHGLCIVPGLSFDVRGYRLGYGKGFYDRFLSGFGGTAVGICYSECMRSSLPNDCFDIRVSAVITEKDIIKTNDIRRTV